MNDYLIVYLMGIAVAFVIYLIRMIFEKIILFLIHGNVLNSNLRKITKKTNVKKWQVYLLLMVLNILNFSLSWICVLFELFNCGR